MHSEKRKGESAHVRLRGNNCKIRSMISALKLAPLKKKNKKQKTKKTAPTFLA